MSAHDAHGHGHHHGHAHHHGGSRLGVAFALNLTFTVVELIGAWWTNSTAIAADAVHDLGDSLALAFAWAMQGLSGRQGNASWTFGYRRLSLLGALVNAAVLLVGGGLVLVEALPRLWDPQPADPTGMAALAVLGVLVNGAAVLRLRGGEGMNEKVATWHLIEDVLGWVAVLVVSGVMHVVDAPWLDPALALIVTAVVTSQAARHLVHTVRLFLQAVPPGLSVEGMRATLAGVEGVIATHHLHLWSQDGEHHVLTGRLQVGPGLSLDEATAIRERARHALEHAGVGHATLEVCTQGGDPGCGG